jgi:thioredoxin reductase/NAD-dependent dihydropyrimidine dehydrogenase PreA subunit
VSAPGSAGRRRRVELAVETSDVRRFRGFARAALLGAAAVLFALLFVEGPRSATAPGPLARPHAALACANCHATEAASASAACAQCHGERRSERRAHTELVRQGELTCASCHSVHRGEHGLAFETDGSVHLYGSGFETEIAPAGAAETPRLSREIFVPLIAEAACARCHDPENPRDLAAHCFAGANPPGGFALCFDEHRKVATASATQPAARDAAVEAARALAQSTSLHGASRLATLGPNALYLLFGLAVSFVVVRFANTRAAARAKPNAAPLPRGVRRLPVIDPARCLGCEACVDACPFDALEVRRYVAVLARPDDCCGAGPCQEACPNGSLLLRGEPVALEGPVLSEALECPERRGLFLAGDVTGGSLVRNAVRQGVAVAETIARRKRAYGQGPIAHDLIVVGAGPAGLAAALRAQALGLTVRVLEQASIAESIRRFSRGKLVLDAGSSDEQAPLWLGDAPKEELLKRWLYDVRSARLDVREGSRVMDISANDPTIGGFSVTVEREARRETQRAAQVLIAAGARGTPRALPVPVPESLEGRVHYELSDARTFAGKRVIVVGLGDVAMETALALAAQPGSEVSVAHRAAGFRRGKQRNIDALSALVARGRVKICFRTEVEGFGPSALVVRCDGKRSVLPFDALFVHIGSVPAHDLLRAAGVAFARRQE